MKLAFLNPELELSVEDLYVKQVNSLSRPSRSNCYYSKTSHNNLFFFFCYELQLQDYFTNLPVVIASKPSIMVDVPLFPLDQQGSLDLSVINLSQTTSTEAVRIFIYLKTYLIILSYCYLSGK